MFKFRNIPKSFENKSGNTLNCVNGLWSQKGREEIG